MIVEHDVDEETVTVQKSTRKRRRTFYAITPELHSCKTIKMSELLLPNIDDRRFIVRQTLPLIQKYDALWMLSVAVEIPKTPMWVGFNTKFIDDYNKKRKIRYLTPVNESPTEKKVIIETMKESLKIAEELGKKNICVSYDLDIARVAMQMQSIEKPVYDNLFIHLGAFDIMLVYFKAMGKFIAGCSLMNVDGDSELLDSGSVVVPRKQAFQ